LVGIGLILLLNVFIIKIGDYMKKILYMIILFLLPCYVLAYSNYIIPGGDTVGIEIKGEGVVVVGFYKVDGKYINNYLQLGDRIVKVENNNIVDTKSMIEIIEKNINNNSVNITYIRDNKEYVDKLELYKDNDEYKTGLYIKGDLLGIGTLTYIDPESNIYGILGHSLNYSYSNDIIDIYKGNTYEAYIKGFTKSTNGLPGSKNADIKKKNIFGSLTYNSSYGIFGNTNKNLNRERMEVAAVEDVKLGDAFILTSNKNNEIEKYKIKILDVDSRHKDKNFYFEIVDYDLLEMSGGIVQGMSGSPIIQNNKIIGAVTRVLVDDVRKGYGISIITMLEEGDKIKAE